MQEITQTRCRNYGMRRTSDRNIKNKKSLMKTSLTIKISLITIINLAFFQHSLVIGETSSQYSLGEVLVSYPDTSCFNADSILKKAILVDDYIRLVKHPDYWNNTYVGGKSRPSNIWTRGVFYEGHMELYYLNKDTALYNYAYLWAKSHNWEMAYTSNTTTSADNQCCGQTYLELYKLEPDAAKIKNVKSCIDYNISTGKFNYWWWIDAIQMSMPVYALLGQITQDTKYYNYMYKLYNHSKNVEGDSGLYNKADGFWWRDKNFDPPKVNGNGKQIYWSRGNGWVYAALARVLKTIPSIDTNYKEYLEDFLSMSRALVACQREDGFWNSNLADPNEYGGKETSGTSMFVYGLAWGLNNGILDRGTYLMAAKKGWTALSRDAIHDNGFIGWMQGTGDDPSDDQPLGYDKVPNFEDYGAGCVLLAAAESYKLAATIEKEDSIPTGISNPIFPLFTKIISYGSEVRVINAGDSFLIIYNTSGIMVHQGKTSDNEPFIVETTNWPEGIYIVKIFGKTGNKVMKFRK